MEDFENLLFENYREYLDEDGNVRSDREENFQAFVYMVDRILTSVNADVNKYRGSTRKLTNLSKVFSASDEAFALLLVENYWKRWMRLRSQPKEVPKEYFNAKYTDSRAGRVTSGFNTEGIKKYNDLVKMVREKRAKRETGEMLEQYLQGHWRGKIGGGTKKQAQETVVGVVDMDGLFGADGVPV